VLQHDLTKAIYHPHIPITLRFVYHIFHLLSPFVIPNLYPRSTLYIYTITNY